MRGQVEFQGSFVLLSPEQCVPADHPLRAIKARADAALVTLRPHLEALYASTGRPSIPPESLLKATLLIALYSVRSERLFCEQLGYNYLFRWFVDLDGTSPGWDASTFSKNRTRLLEAQVAEAFLAAIVEQARSAGLLHDEHFTVDGTLIGAWASHKSVRPKDGPDEPRGDGSAFRGTRRSNATHQSTTDPDARLTCKGNRQAARLCLEGHALVDSRTGLCYDFQVTSPTGHSEPETALALLRRQRARGIRPQVVTADKGYDRRTFIEGLTQQGLTSHVAYNRWAHSPGASPPPYTRTPGYGQSQRWRKKIEQVFGWLKQVGGLRQTRYRGIARTNYYAPLAVAGYNLIRLTQLAAS